MGIEEDIRLLRKVSVKEKTFVNIVFTYNTIIQQFEEFLKPYDITSQQYNVLRILKGQHPRSCNMGYIKDVMLDKNPDLTRLSNRLVLKQLIKKNHNLNNKREILINLTPKGLKTLDVIAEDIIGFMENIIALNEAEAEIVSDLLDKLREPK